MFEQIDSIVRRANPVPDSNALRTTTAPAFIERAAEATSLMEPDGDRRLLGRGLIIGAVAAGVVVLAGVVLSLSGGRTPVGDGMTTTTDATTTTTSSTTTTTSPSTTVSSNALLPAFPPGRIDLVHGGETWVVVLAAAVEYEDPVLTEAVDVATAAGYSTGPTDCDSGAATALGLDENEAHYYTVSVYFETEQDAHDALTAFRARGTDGGVVQVQTFCLD